MQTKEIRNLRDNLIYSLENKYFYNSCHFLFKDPVE